MCFRSLLCFYIFCENCIILVWLEFDKEKNLCRLVKCLVCDDDILVLNLNILLKDWVWFFFCNDLLEKFLNVKNGCIRCVFCLRVVEDKDVVYYC